MFIGEHLVIKGPSYQVIQPDGRPFFLGRLLRKGEVISYKSGVTTYSDVFEFEHMPSSYEFPVGIHNCRYVEVFSIATRREPATRCCCCWSLFDIYENTGPIYIQR
jgi:hypothetical protein